jgi:hypothetical protein
MTQDENLFEDDPVLGKFIAYYPSNRLRLLMIAGVSLSAIWFVITILLWNVEAEAAFFTTIGIISVAALMIGWYVLHLWNREIVLYARGFSYRRGSQMAYLRYDVIHTIRQQGEVISYFGGLVQRNTYRFTMLSDVGEIITLDATFANLEDLTLKLESAITQVNIPRVEHEIAEGRQVAFTDELALSDAGIIQQDRTLPWGDFSGFQTKNGLLIIYDQHEVVWYQVPLSHVVNIRLLVTFLRRREARTVKE